LLGQPHPNLPRHRKIRDDLRPEPGAEVQGLQGGCGGRYERAGLLDNPLPEFSTVIVVLDDEHMGSSERGLEKIERGVEGEPAAVGVAEHGESLVSSLHLGSVSRRSVGGGKA
jgi:hypothetical protein